MTLAARARLWVLRALPGSIWEGKAARFSRFHSARARSVLASFEMYKTLAGAMILAHRSIRATEQKRRKIAPQACSTALDAPIALGRRFGTVRGRLGTRSGALLDRLRPLWTRPGRLKIAPRAVFGRPELVPSASRRVPETALSAQNRPRSNFRRFWLDFRRFSNDFSSIFA